MPAVTQPKVFLRPVPDFIGQKGPNGDYITPVLVSLDVGVDDPLHNAYRVDDAAWAWPVLGDPPGDAHGRLPHPRCCGYVADRNVLGSDHQALRGIA